MKYHPRPYSAFVAVVCLLGSPAGWAQESVDLHSWTAESYPAVSGLSDGKWTVSQDGQSVYQSRDGQPTLFVSDFNTHNMRIEGSVKVSASTGDDDFIGFAIGFRPGDTRNGATEYLLVDWVRRTQSLDFGSPSCTPGGTARSGLAVSRVSGTPTADEFWGHATFDASCSDSHQGLEELDRGGNLGDVGWVRGQVYSFAFNITPNSLRVFVDGALELDIAGQFADGPVSFYSFSQDKVTYQSFTVRPIAAPVCAVNGPYEGAVQEAILFDGGGSLDPDGDIVSYEWDFGDGGTGSGVTVAHEYQTPGEYAITLSVIDNDGVRNFCKTTAAISDMQEAEAILDIQPMSCPNSLNWKKKGVIPVAILGTSSFRVRDIDLSTLQLEGVAPLRSSYEDVTTSLGRNECECTTESPDGHEDLSLKFDAPQVIGRLGDVTVGGTQTLKLTGNLRDGTAIWASDCVIIRGPSGRPGAESSPIMQITVRTALESNRQTVDFELSREAEVKLSVFDVAGRVVQVIDRSVRPPGAHSVEWNASRLPSGMYFYRLEAEGAIATRKMVLVKE